MLIMVIWVPTMEQRKSAFPWVFQLFKKRKENRSTSDEGFASNTSSENEVNTTLVADKPGIDDFQIIRKIGKGGFGRVFLAKHTNQNKLVALKVIVKKEVPESKSDKEHVKAEHFVQTNMSHPFIAKLFCSFQTKSKIFYALEFLQGGELFSWMEKFERFSEVIWRHFLHAHYSKSQIFVQKFNFDKTPNIFTSFSTNFFFDNFSREIKVVKS